MKQLSEKQKTILALAAKKKLSYDTVYNHGADSRTLNSLINRGFLSKTEYRTLICYLWFYEITGAGRDALCQTN